MWSVIMQKEIVELAPNLGHRIIERTTGQGAGEHERTDEVDNLFTQCDNPKETNATHRSLKVDIRWSPSAGAVGLCTDVEGSKAE